MKELLQKYLDNGLADFQGLEITGNIPIKQDLINAVIAEALKPDPQAAPAPASADLAVETETEHVAVPVPVVEKPKKSSGIDRKSLISLVKSMVTRADVEATDGKLIIHFALRR